MIRLLSVLLVSSTLLLSDTRGIRNNNPGNIVAGEKWVGRSGTDGRFVRFKAPEYGIRAMGKIINTYQKRHKINTISGIIGRWAPKHENNTQQYIKYVSKQTGLKPSQKLNIFDSRGKLKKEHELKLIVGAIIKMENGSDCSYSNAVYEKAFKMLR